MFQSTQILEKFDGARPQAKVRLTRADPRHILNNSDALRDIVTRQSFLNAIAVINVVGGSTNAVCAVVPLACALVIDERIGSAPSCDGQGS